MWCQNYFQNNSLDKTVNTKKVALNLKSSNLEIQANSFDMNQFNKVKFLQANGLLNARLNYETLQFERSWSLRWRTYLVTLMKATMPLKLVASLFFEQKDEIQLLIGTKKIRNPDSELYSSLTSNSKLFLATRKPL